MTFQDVKRELREETCVLRATHDAKGRTLWLSPDRAPVSQLNYRRIRLDANDSTLRFSAGDHEIGLILLGGTATVLVEGNGFDLSQYDALYIPRDAGIAVFPGPYGCDLAEISAAVEHRYPLRFVQFTDVQKDPGLHFTAGAPGSERNLNILIGKNVEAGRIVAGVTFSKPGNWTSWPPHEHADTLEEAYVYIDMPAPAWGVQFVYTDPQSPELMTVVREGDCVIMPKGYHPNVAAPGGSINFLWMMAAHREGIDRQFGVVNVQPEYATNGSGLEKGRG